MALKPEEVQVIRNMADDLGIPQDFALGITDKESNGRVLWQVGSQYLPAIRFEGHYFDQRLTKRQQEVARRLGLSSPKAQAVKNPTAYKARYELLKAAADINFDAAYESISIGMGQVMGAHWKLLGYKSAYHMWKEACKGVVPQASMMLMFIAKNPNLLRAAKQYDYETFARGYNGKSYKKNRYDTELRTYVNKWKSGVLVVDKAVKIDPWVQRILDLGFNTVREFQGVRGLNPDGIVGPLTRSEVVEAENERKTLDNAPAKDAGKIAAGGLAAGGLAAAGPTIAEQVKEYEPAIGLLQSIAANGATIGLIVVGTAIGVAVGTFVYRKWIKK